MESRTTKENAVFKKQMQRQRYLLPFHTLDTQRANDIAPGTRQQYENHFAIYDASMIHPQ